MKVQLASANIAVFNPLFMRTLLFCFALLVHLTMMAQDSTSVSSTESMRFLVTRLTEELNLTESQQEQLKTILQQRSSDLSEARVFEKGTEQRRNLVREVNQSARESMRSVLSAEQFETFVRIRKETKDQKNRYYTETGETPPAEDEETDF